MGVCLFVTQDSKLSSTLLKLLFNFVYNLTQDIGLVCEKKLPTKFFLKQF